MTDPRDVDAEGKDQQHLPLALLPPTPGTFFTWLLLQLLIILVHVSCEFQPVPASRSEPQPWRPCSKPQRCAQRPCSVPARLPHALHQSVDESAAAEALSSGIPLSQLDSNALSASDAKKLAEMGIHTVEALAHASSKVLLAVKGLSDAKVKKMKDAGASCLARSRWC